MIAPRCVCGSDKARPRRKNGLLVLRCDCGVERQRVDLSPEELADWYRSEYLRHVYYHTPEQDREVANLRLEAYKLERGTKLLDIGSGNGAFVEAARMAGIDAWGHELGREGSGEHIFSGETLYDVGFPSASFDVATMHDVLEHVPDPVAFLKEARRLLRDGGELIVDFPRFHHESGRHHWKPVEHIWLLDDAQLVRLLEGAGFTPTQITHPVESKTVVRCTRPPEQVATVLVPPGIGDGYWVATKLHAVLGDMTPEIWVDDGQPQRSEHLWRNLPDVRWGGYRRLPRGPQADEAYKGTTAVQTNVAGCDYFISLNGCMDAGLHIDTAIPGPTDWHPRMHRTKAQRTAEVEYRMRFGRYVVAGFWDKGFYQQWRRQHPYRDIVNTLLKLQSKGYEVVLMGAEWDRAGIMGKLKGALPDAHDMIGKTSLPELFALLSKATAVFGDAAGSTIMGTVLGTPTLMLWGPNFPEAMRTNAIPPGAPCRAMPTSKASRDALPALLDLTYGSS